MRSLLWKEWHEQRWKLAFGSLILAMFALIGLRARAGPDDQMLEGVCMLSVLLLPVLASTGLIPAERSDGTMETLLSLPVAPSVLFAVKTLIGMLLCAGPLLAAAVVSILVAGGREVSSAEILGLYGRTLLTTLVLFFWMFALTVRLPNETRAALVAMGVLISWLLIHFALMFKGDDPSQYIPSKFWVINPFVFLFGFIEFNNGSKYGMWAVSLLLAAGVQGAVALALWLVALRQLPAPKEG